jgi:hypothetical protein
MAVFRLANRFRFAKSSPRRWLGGFAKMIGAPLQQRSVGGGFRLSCVGWFRDRLGGLAVTKLSAVLAHPLPRSLPLCR